MRFILKHKWLVGIFVTQVIFYAVLQVMIRTIPLPKEGIVRPSSTLIFDANGELLRAFTSSDGMWRIQTSIEHISPELKSFLINYEDRWFYKHPGINPLAILRAVVQNIKNGEIISGGSTITMQIARMMKPKDRTLINKIIEAFRALQLEYYYTKDQLLEIYFNIAPYGGNIEGAAAASWMYFGKEPAQLSYAEAAMLAVLPNSPSYLRPDLYPQDAREARDKILFRMVQFKVLQEKDYLEAIKEPVPTRRIEWPFIAPHFSTGLQLAHPERSRIYSTLDKKLQLIAEDLLTKHLSTLEQAGVTNGSVVIIDNQTHELKALVGSKDFFSEANSGQVNGALASRSPGSTLKPFIYALGLKQGLISPGSYLEDVPVDYSGYAPENYDRKFSGIVAAREALERSLNVPAVNLLASMNGMESLYDVLEKVGIDKLRSEESYGLALALGGGEISLLELTDLYSALANQGQFFHHKELQEEETPNPIELFDAGTSFIITEILANVRRPDLPAVWEFTTLPKVAWKTGTSYGHRDAWSIGYNPMYTIGIWIGNFDGQPAKALVGANAAAPLLFDLFTELSRGKQIKWFNRPDNVKVRKVCSLSGQLPTEYCDSLKDEYYLVDRSPIKECEFHKLILIDEETGYRLPDNYSGQRPFKEQIYIQWPPRVANWMIQNGYQINPLPELLPEYQRQIVGQNPVINSPKENVIYYLRKGISSEYQKIAFSAAVASDARKVYWFVDGTLVGSVNVGEKFFYLPKVGEHRLVCQDDQGRLTEMNLVVKNAEP